MLGDKMYPLIILNNILITTLNYNFTQNNNNKKGVRERQLSSTPLPEIILFDIMTYKYKSTVYDKGGCLI
jgi:hypothetical protein